MYISDYKTTSYNLQFTRFILAISVIFSHCFPLSTGNTSREWMCVLTIGQMSFGKFAVAIFFLFGGYYSAHTVIQKADNRYIVFRLKRLIPELLIVVVSCILLGSLLSSLNVAEYFTDCKTWRYLLNSVFILQHELPGVFTGNIYNPTVNGALWTIPVEFICNVGCFIAFRMNLLSKKLIPITTLLVILSGYLIRFVGVYVSVLESALLPCLLFYVGILFFLYGNKIKLLPSLFIGTIILFLLSIPLGFMTIGMVIFLPYVCFYIWFGNTQIADHIANIGKYSYSIYLWGFPIQQTVVHYFGGSMNPYINFAISTPLIIILGIGTYNTVCFAKSYKMMIR